MSGYIGNDGSALAGGLNPSGVVQGLSVDSGGKLNVNATSGPTNITQVSGSNVGATNGLPVSGNNGGSLVVIGVDASGRLILVPNTAFNMSQIGGYSPRVDNGNLGSSLYGKNASAGDTSIAVDSSGRLQTASYIGGAAVGNTNPYPTYDQVDALIAAGQGYVAVAKISTTNASNAGLAIFNPASSGKNALIYRATQVLNGGNVTTELRNNTADFALGTSVTPANLKAGGAAGVVTSSSAASGATGGVGTLLGGLQSGSNVSLELLQINARILLPSGTQAYGFELLANPSVSNTLYLAIYWVEY